LIERKQALVEASKSNTGTNWSKRSLEERAIAVVMIAPFFVTFALYVAWVIHNGGDPTARAGLLRATVVGPLLTTKNILGIFVNGAMNSIIVGLVGVLVGSMYGVFRSLSQPPAPFETTLDDLIGQLEGTRAEIGGGAKVAVSRNGGTWPLDLSRIGMDELPGHKKNDPVPTALVINI
jgi:hypothetical protein